MIKPLRQTKGYITLVKTSDMKNARHPNMFQAGLKLPQDNLIINHVQKVFARC